jgi:hypothetical protein
MTDAIINNATFNWRQLLVHFQDLANQAAKSSQGAKAKRIGFSSLDSYSGE